MVHRTRRFHLAFTLVELLVVIGIIAVLIGILIPVVGRVRTNAYIADTKNFISVLQGSIDRYHNDFRAYPGPISNNNIADTGFTTSNYPTAPTAVATTLAPGFNVTFDPTKITGSENLVLGLLGGLSLDNTGTKVMYNPAQIGLGPMNLSAVNPKRYPSYGDAINLSWNTDSGGLKTGNYTDSVNLASDTIIPEFVDRFPDPMPILYLRSRVAVDPQTPTAEGSPTLNSVVTYTLGFNSTNPGAQRVGSYDLSQVIGYTDKNAAGQYIGIGRTVKASDYVPSVSGPPLPHGLVSVTVTGSSCASLDKSSTNYKFPYDAFPYFLATNFAGIDQNTSAYPTTPLYPRQKDSYILIAPGRDRTYGTSDDICSFGDVNP